MYRHERLAMMPQAFSNSQSLLLRAEGCLPSEDLQSGCDIQSLSSFIKGSLQRGLS